MMILHFRTYYPFHSKPVIGSSSGKFFSLEIKNTRPLSQPGAWTNRGLLSLYFRPDLIIDRERIANILDAMTVLDGICWGVRDW